MRNYIRPDVALKSNHGPCRWIAVRLNGAHTQCGKPSVLGSPYCEEHGTARVVLNNQPRVKTVGEPVIGKMQTLPEELKAPARRRLTSKPPRQDPS